jgi:hypothetical protein
MDLSETVDGLTEVGIEACYPIRAGLVDPFRMPRHTRQGAMPRRTSAW